MLQPMRMWRLSDSDLYCVAMKIRRSPELMQLLRTKSMMRYGPPKYTAGLARSFVSGIEALAGAAGEDDDEAVVEQRGHRSSAPAQDDARRGAVGSDDRQRQAEHLVDARLHVAEVQALDHDRAAAEQHVMGRARPAS